MKDEPKEPGEIQGENLDALRHTMAHILANVIVSSATIEAMARSAAGNVNNMLTTEHFEGNNAMKQALKRASEAIDISDGIRNSILESKPITDIREAERRAERMFSDDISKIINEITSKLIASMPDSIADLFYNELLDGVTRAIGEERERLNKFYESEQWAELRAAFPDMTEGDGAAILFSGLADQITEYLPELKAKIAEYEEETGHKLTFSELTELEAEEGKIPEPLLSKFIQEIRNIRAEEPKEKTPTAIIKRIEKLLYPLDKFNSNIWGLTEDQTRGKVALNMAKHGSGEKLIAYYSIDFENLSDSLKISKRLEPYDKRVYIAISGIFNAGYDIVTLSQIYYAMGYTKRPSKYDLNKIDNAITKMTTARITINNAQEAKAYNYPLTEYDSSLLPLERKRAIVNGKVTDGAIHLFREPPLMTFARERKQVGTVPIKLLQSPVSKTNKNLPIDDFLMQRIMTNKTKKPFRILYKTLYEHTDILNNDNPNSVKTAKKRTREQAQTYLEYYRGQGFINDFAVERDGFSIMPADKK